MLNTASADPGITLSAWLSILILVISRLEGWKSFVPLSNFKIEYRVSGEAFLTKPNKTTYMIQNIIKKITKIKPQLSTTGGTSDARFIRKIAPCLEFGLVGKTMHKVDEAVSISDLKKLTKIYSEILKNYF